MELDCQKKFKFNSIWIFFLSYLFNVSIVKIIFIFNYWPQLYEFAIIRTTNCDLYIVPKVNCTYESYYALTCVPRGICIAFNKSIKLCMYYICTKPEVYHTFDYPNAYDTISRVNRVPTVIS